MAAYVLFENLEVVDPAKLEAYARRAAPLVAAHGGRYVVLGGPSERLEGEWVLRAPVMIEFPSLAQARAWYDGDAYRELRELRQAAMRGRAVILAGLPDVGGAR